MSELPDLCRHGVPESFDCRSCYIETLKDRIAELERAAVTDDIQPVIAAAMDLHNDIDERHLVFYIEAIRRLWLAVDAYKEALQGKGGE